MTTAAAYREAAFGPLVLLLWPPLTQLAMPLYPLLGYQLSLGGGILLFLVSGLSIVVGVVALAVVFYRKTRRPAAWVPTLTWAASVSLVLAILANALLLSTLTCSLTDECTRGI